MVFPIFLISLAIVLLTFSARGMCSVLSLLGKRRKNFKYWKILCVFTLFFILAYGGVIVVIALEWFDSLLYLLGLVFFFGSLFVFVVTLIGLRTINEMEEEVQKRTADLGLAREEADKATQAKSNFLAVMSHEMRTPLSSIIAALDILNDMKLNSKQIPYMNILQRASRNLLNQINDVLDFSKIEAGKLKLEEVPMLLNKSIQNILSIMGIRCQEKGIKLESEINLPKSLTVIGDAGRLEQILINLLGNAIKFTLEGSVSLKVKQKEERDKEIIIEFIVADTGIGIPADKIDQIFNSFFQVEARMTRRFGGTGLGLAICKNLVEMMGGKIQAQAREDPKGTAFSFYICLEKTHSYINLRENKSEIDLQESAFKKMRVLLVEDNEDNRHLFQIQLKSAGLNLSTAENGAVAVQKVCKEKPYDLIFMDIQMPVMDGFTAMRTIREWELENNKESVPIIALTASCTKEDMLKSFQYGCAEYLSKPIRKQALLEAVSRYASKRGEQAREGMKRPMQL